LHKKKGSHREYKGVQGGSHGKEKELNTGQNGLQLQVHSCDGQREKKQKTATGRGKIAKVGKSRTGGESEEKGGPGPQAVEAAFRRGFPGRRIRKIEEGGN